MIEENKKTIAEIQAITDRYADSSLECDGMTNVLHYYLTQASIRHCVYEGYVDNVQGGDGISWHRWIEVETQEGHVVIDYRARMWLEDILSIPHGVFLPEQFPHIHYHGQQTHLPILPEHIILFLLT